ncbi:MAG: N-acetylmuramoyl-L-alanine amidase [Rhodobacteraceae bacterium]|nr:N-acetylmuramoyl-L-alanine amidase [Paracoccaceae bacterium]
MNLAGISTIHQPSPNFGDRRDGCVPELIVIHYTGMDSTAAALERLCAPEHEVSAHYLISERGTVYRLVDEERRAWHAGAGAWRGRADVNSRSLGIELANDGCTPFAARQMSSLESLLRELVGRWSIPASGILGHSDMAVGRKFDPGPRFDWKRLASVGLSAWPRRTVESAANWPEFVRAAKDFGYSPPAEIDRRWRRALLWSVRSRFRPWAEGDLDEQDMAVVAGLQALRTGCLPVS